MSENPFSGAEWAPLSMLVSRTWDAARHETAPNVGGPRGAAAKIAAARWGMMGMIELPAVLGIAALGVSFARAGAYRTHVIDSAVQAVVAEDQTPWPPGRLPTLFGGPFLIEISENALGHGAALFDRTVGLGGFQHEGGTALIGIEFPSAPLDECDLSWSGDPQVGSVLTYRVPGREAPPSPTDWLERAREFATTFAYLLDQEPPVFETIPKNVVTLTGGGQTWTEHRVLLSRTIA